MCRKIALKCVAGVIVGLFVSCIAFIVLYLLMKSPE